ncbi:ImpA family type VI secretion system protein [Serratia inhibens]|uniref:type VI secretion system protein TssA n=1 Tax=Serratia inhibens TaxID=2338073 RepID=UPI00025E39A6|nr:type VI secretion system ImpA family N-terminal domain-containing protein [Serratia inhibens]ANS44538.1 hypothetical protein Q5A_020575 [Serratia inhibens PRI-2C]
MSELNIVCPDWYQALLQPSAVKPPCGESIEYDATFIMLQGRLQPRLSAEYGDFVEAMEPLNWAEIERDTQALLVRSKDIRLVMILIRCRLRQIGVTAVNEGLEALLCLLEQWPDALHPQLLDEDEFVPLMRANVFAELEAPEGFMADFRQQMLPRAAGLHLSVRDVERAYASPREESAPSALTMSAVQQAWREEAAIASLQQAAARLQQLKNLLQNTLGEDAPDFDRLLALLNLFGTTPIKATSPVPAQPEIAVTEISSSPLAITTESITERVAAASQIAAVTTSENLGPQKIENRDDALDRLREVRAWFVHTEPSSPVISLLAFTEKTIGKGFFELVQYIPAELIATLEKGQESP